MEKVSRALAHRIGLKLAEKKLDDHVRQHSASVRALSTEEFKEYLRDSEVIDSALNTVFQRSHNEGT